MLLSPATIESVKSRADILQIVQEVVQLRRDGRSWKGLCPFHGEKTPSFYVNIEKRQFHCFGCRAHGNTIDFVMQNEGLSFPEAIRSLADRLGIDVENGTPQDREKAEAERRENLRLYAINSLAAKFFVDSLWGGEIPQARGAGSAYEELDRRGLFERPDEGTPIGETLRKFQVGYAPAAWRGLTRFLEREKVSLELAEKVGLVMPGTNGYHDRFRSRLMFAVIDHLGRVVGFSGRALPLPEPRYADDPRYGEKDKPAKYINTPETPIYTKGSTMFGLWQAKDAIRTAGHAMLVEGNFDVVSLHARGIEHVVAPLGTAFTETQAKILRRYTSAAVIAFDGDAAGKKATYEARKPIRASKMDARVVLLPSKEDPDSFTYRHGPKALLDLESKAVGLREHLLRECFAGVTSSLDSQNKATQAVKALLAEEPDPLIQNVERGFADQLLAQVNIREKTNLTLRGLEANFYKSSKSSQGEGPPPIPELEDPVAFAVIGAVLDFPSVVRHPDVQRVLSVVDGDTALAIVAAQEQSADVVLERMPEPLRIHAQARLAVPVFMTEDAARATILANGAKLWERSLEDQEEEVRKELEEAERAHDEVRVTALLQDLMNLAKKRVARR